jgi:cathepsin A (carboxypeptidase C)
LSKFLTVSNLGNYDLVCNFYGSAEMINTMQWSGQQAFNSAQNVTWNYNGNAVGNSRTANGLTFVVVYNAGHMVPHDQVLISFVFECV